MDLPVPYIVTISFGYILYCSCFNLFCNVWVCGYCGVCEYCGVCVCVCLCGRGYCNVRVCLCVVLVMCGCFRNLYTCVYCVLYALYCVFCIVAFMCILI